MGIVDRLEREFNEFEEELEQKNGKEVLNQAYKFVCCMEMVEHLKDSGTETLSGRTIEQLEKVPEDASLLEFLYQIWLKCDTNISDHIWDSINGRLSYETDSLASF